MATKFNSYNEFAEDFKKCRSKRAGRPIRGWCRLYREGNDYVVKLLGWRSDNKPLFRVTPDNIITFVAPVNEMLMHKQTLVSSLRKVIPIIMERKRRGIYVIAGTRDPQYLPTASTGMHTDWGKVRKHGPEYFNGIKFDLLTGLCLNAQPNMTDTIIPEMRKAWLRDVKRFKKGLKARAKVGALEEFIRDLGGDISQTTVWAYQRNLPRWDSDEITQLVLGSMKTEQYPAELLKLMVETTWLGRVYDITNQDVIKNVDKVFDNHSVHFRQAYGVFGDTVHIKE